jgi:hypothetical protein
MVSRHEVLQKTGKYVDTVISQLSRDFDPQECCTKAFEDLGRLVKESRTMVAGDDVPSMFADGIQAVISRLDAFRTGFARTYEQENGGVTKGDAWAEWKTPAALKPISKALSPSEFVSFAKDTIAAAQKCADLGYAGRALEALRLLKADIRKAESFEDTVANSISVTVTTDPMQIVWTEAAGTTSPAGTSRPDEAASNYVTNPTAVTAPPPETGKNPGTASLAEAKSNTPAADSNFVAVGGGDGVAKAADEAITKNLEAMGEVIEKSNPDYRCSKSGWTSDLSSPDFLRGKRRESF